MEEGNKTDREEEGWRREVGQTERRRGGVEEGSRKDREEEGWRREVGKTERRRGGGGK